MADEVPLYEFMKLRHCFWKHAAQYLSLDFYCLGGRKKKKDKIEQGIFSSTVLTWVEKAVFKETSPFLPKLKQVQTSFLAKKDKDNFCLGEVLAWHQVEVTLYSVI